MRRFFRVLPLLLLALSCAKTTLTPSVRLDFVGANRFTSSTRTVSAGDTLASKIYAETGDTALKIRRLRILLTSSPTRTPVIYPVAGYNPVPDPPLVYLDSLLPKGTNDLVIVNLLSARTTSGSDLWEYKITDTLGQSASRAYRLVLRRTDSLTAVLHSYRAFLSPVPYGSKTLTPAQNRGFAYVGLRQGLLLPHFAVASKPAVGPNPNRSLVDLVCIATGADIRLASAGSTNIFPQRSAQLPTTQLRSTTLGNANFSTLTTNVLLRAAFDNGSAYGGTGGPFPGDQSVTAPLVKADVIAFLITDPVTKIQKYGALFVSDLVRTPTATVTCQVVVEK